METVSNAMGKRSGMSPVDDFIREMLAASPQGHIDESFEALNDPSVRRANGLQTALFDPGRQESDAPVDPRDYEGGQMPILSSAPNNTNQAAQRVIAEAMQQPPIPTEEMNARPYPPTYGTIEDDDPDYGPPALDPENSPQDYIAQNFPRRDERLATPGWIPGDEPGVAEGDVSRFDDKRSASTSRTMGSVPGATAPFRLRGPVNMQMEEQNLIQRLLGAFR